MRLHLNNIDDKVDTLAVMLTVMVKRMILANAPAVMVGTGSDRNDSITCPYSLITNSFLGVRFTICIAAIEQSVSRTATGFAFDKQRFNTYGARAGPIRTGF